MRRVFATAVLAMMMTGTVLAGRGGVMRQILTFETPSDLSTMKIERTDAAGLSDRHFLSGKHSLQWRYRGGESLQLGLEKFYVDNDAATKEYGNPAVSVVVLHLYQEQPQPGKKLRVEFGRSDRQEADCWFDFGLDFSGWRTGWVAYSRDMQGTPHPDMDFIRLKAPEGSEGTLFLDDLIPCVVIDRRHQEPDLQLPFVRYSDEFDNSETLGNPWLTTHLKPQIAEQLSAEEIAGFRTIERHFDEDFNGENPKMIAPAAVPKQMESIRKAFEEFGIRRSADGVITGRPVFFVINPRMYELVRNGAEISKDFVLVRQYGTMMLRLAQSYRRTSDPEFRRMLGEYFELMVRHLLDQGYVYGSNMGARHIAGYGTREMFGALILMRDLLAEKGLREEIFRMGQWHFDLNSTLDERYYILPNADQFNIDMRSMLISIMMLPDTPEKAARLKAFSAFFNRNLSWETPGWMGGFKPDGMVFHHWGHYPAYVYGAMAGASRICWLLSDTPWAATPEALKTLKKAINAADVYCISDTALALHGRVPFRIMSNSMIAFCARMLGKAGDAQMASLYRRLGGKKAAAEPLFRDVTPAPLPQGHWSFNYGGMGVHRYHDKAVTLKTYNHYVWGYESYLFTLEGTNRFGRYLSNGAMEILPLSGPVSVGRIEAGWDWNRFPGTTSLNRPWEVLMCPPEKRIDMLTMVGNRINGSSNLEQQYGAFGSILTEPDQPPRFDPTFRAVKSVFAFGPRLIALGGPITSESEYPVETTLFQYGVQVKDGVERPVFINSAKAIEGETDQTLEEPCFLADANDNAYFVFRSGGKIRVRRGLQESRSHKTLEPISGKFATAWLEHGVKPDMAGYEYLVVLDLAPEQAEAYFQELQQKKPYRVLRQDAQVHAVEDFPSGVTAAIFFEAQPELNWPLLRSVEQPCYVMYRRTGENALSLSLNTPDLAGFIREGYCDLPEVKQDVAAENRDRLVRIRLAGNWHLAEPVAGVELKQENGDTVISGAFRHGIAKQLQLRK